jgi:hypothetical protein
MTLKPCCCAWPRTSLYTLLVILIHSSDPSTSMQRDMAMKSMGMLWDVFAWVGCLQSTLTV